MLSNTLVARLKPFKKVCNSHALSQTYRCLQFTGQQVRGCAGFGTLEASVAGLEITEPFAVDGSTFLAVMDSLPDNVDVALTLENGVVNWKCGSGKGKLATVSNASLPPITWRSGNNAASVITKEFKTALDLGALSCGNNAMTSVGIYGVVIDNRQAPMVMSFDNTTISKYVYNDKFHGAPDLFALSPEAADLLATVADPEGRIEFSDDALLYSDNEYKLHINALPKLRYDLASTAEPFSHAESTIPIPADRIQAFVKRATALAESSKNTFVDIGIQDGRLTLAFIEGTAASDEYFLVDGLSGVDHDPVRVDATMISRAMTEINQLVIDHFDRDVLVFRGAEGKFSYYIIGVKK